MQMRMGDADKEGVGGAGAHHRDPAFEFNAPRFYDFQRLSDNVPSPPSQGEDYFNSSQTKGARGQDPAACFTGRTERVQH